ncbi:dihydrolipoamide S-acetyltransferase [Capsaspora owczarzaki ATCC 30864]|uniref:Dihydrolipoamide acetyltransferase component of pyruvate dehydrogenase complex n=1 Tax=Capsaspora owczarzaki (strain ATCC 30864) TaxID=595528 RepID=A0A0D2X0C8_CAPO3|nr:dihydrolipoamide S-acetyltransferase [Capsaspora owczarzaki ATCC 30864]KJE88834.1 dihydrolipoamide S-acetyltransferase [Capsaspora owczarzaki ATCC 30864]|eukprot:XP_004365284.1 dihydrolipoamide S-acetyltransferase [Capsaspora owczarzaki ATCC 30864]
MLAHRQATVGGALLARVHHCGAVVAAAAVAAVSTSTLTTVQARLPFATRTLSAAAAAAHSATRASASTAQPQQHVRRGTYTPSALAAHSCCVASVCAVHGKPLQQLHHASSSRAFTSMAASSRAPAPMRVKLPALSPTMTEGTVLKWSKKEGDKVAAGEVLFELETDKATIDVESSEDGVLAKILHTKASGPLAVGTLVALIVDEGVDIATVKVPAADTPAPATPAAAAPKASPAPPTAASAAAPVTPGPAKAPAPAAVAPGSRGPASNVLYPSVYQLVHKHHLDVAQLSGTGPKGRVTKGDILAYLASPGAARSPASASSGSAAASSSRPVSASPSPQSARSWVDVPTTQVRRVIASRLSESKTTIPHSYLSVDCDLSSVIKARSALKKRDATTKISVNDYVVLAAARALRSVPAMNVQWDAKSQSATPLASVDVAFAVATENGLITPIVKRADNLDLPELAAGIRDLSSRARINKLKLDEFQGGSFTISNLGMFGIDRFSAVINPPQCAILAVGQTRTDIKWPAFEQDSDPTASAGSPRAGHFMNVTLSFDERAVSIETASRWLDRFRENLTYFQ